MNGLQIKAIEKGVALAKIQGGDWKKYAYEYYVASKIVEDIMKRERDSDPEGYDSMTLEEKTAVASRAINIIRDRQQVFEYKGKLGL